MATWTARRATTRARMATRRRAKVRIQRTVFSGNSQPAMVIDELCGRVVECVDVVKWSPSESGMKRRESPQKEIKTN
jgi:hypothetical protein